MAIRLADPLEASSLYCLFNFLKFKCSGCNLCPACAPGPYGDGIGTGTGVATLPGAKPLKPPRMCCLHITPCRSCFINIYVDLD